MNADGILGLAPQAMKSEHPDIFIRELKKQKIIPKAMFSLYLSNYQDNQSALWLGGYDHNFLRKFTGNSNLSNSAIDAQIEWIDVAADSKYWQAKLSSIQILSATSQIEPVHTN